MNVPVPRAVAELIDRMGLAADPAVALVPTVLSSRTPPVKLPLDPLRATFDTTVPAVEITCSWPAPDRVALTSSTPFASRSGSRMPPLTVVVMPSRVVPAGTR